MNVIPSSGQIFLINNDSLHCFKKHEADRILEVIYDRQELLEQKLVWEYSESQYLDIIDNLEMVIQNESKKDDNYKHIISSYESHIEFLNKSARQERKRRSIKNGVFITVGIAAFGILMLR